MARADWTIPQMNCVCAVTVPGGGAHEEMLEWPGLSRAQSRGTAPLNFWRIYCPSQTIHVCLQKIQRSSMLHFSRHIRVHSLNIYGLPFVGPHSSSNSFVGIERPSRCGCECCRRSQALRHEHVTDMDQIAMQLGGSGTPRCIRHVIWFQVGVPDSRLESFAGSTSIMSVAMW